jgi:hypothetical protein
LAFSFNLSALSPLLPFSTASAVRGTSAAVRERRIMEYTRRQPSASTAFLAWSNGSWPAFQSSRTLGRLSWIIHVGAQFIAPSEDGKEKGRDSSRPYT